MDVSLIRFMFTLNEVRLQYGPRILFNGISATINARERIGLVGSNGAGKSTLLKILAGEQDFDAGTISAAKNATVGYLPQDGLETHGKTLYAEVESAFEDILSLRKKIETADAELQSLPPDSDEYRETLELISAWERRLEDADAAKLRSRVETILHGLGFVQSDMERDTGEFSGGWQMRIALAKLLLREPALLLLDEPTNHLDIESQDWLENWLSRYAGTVMIVSHDRAFLDTICGKTFALTAGRLEVYNGNYSYFEKTSRERRESLRRAAQNQAREIEKTEEFIERFRAKATKAAQVQSRIKALEKIERIEFEEEDDSQIAFAFPPAPQSGQVVLELNGLDKSYGALNVLKNINFKIERGERIAVVGVNGAGKSTLIRMLAGTEAQTAGTRTEGLNVAVSYFAQHQAKELNPDIDVLATVNDVAAGLGTTRLRTLLGAFLFRGEDVFKPVRVLSGGERNRLALARMLLRPFNFLILDEPTNHLDMRSKAVLAQALKQYTGTFVIVSHDRDFLDPLVTKVIEVKNHGIRVFLGNVSDYLAATAEERSREREKISAAGTVSAKPAVNDPRERRRANAERAKQLAPLRKKLNETETRIAGLETEQADWENKMSSPEFFSRGEATKADVARYETVKTEIAAAYALWESLAEQIEEL
ncbi:MAG: ABC-F family ATP-binding cassette domain-containing protein [Opitutales bacterium]|nr:ABC-F family ATP-binding cassette domain-containing protein [Opitutales bacterium]